MKSIPVAATACMLLFGPASVAAAVSAEEARQLGVTLLPWGAEKAGNKEGTIPAYTGGQVAPPAAFDPKNPRSRPDPFADERPLYSVTSANAAQHAHKLSDGAMALLRKHPDFRIDVYPTHRTQRYPAHVNERSLKNATACRTAQDGLALEGCLGGVPFPIPKTGNEVMWNHNMRYQSPSTVANFRNVLVDAAGGVTVQGELDIWQEYPGFYAETSGTLAPNDPYWLVHVAFVGPARKAGEKLVLVDYVDPINSRRKVWQYLPGQRRVKLTPEVAYDTPNVAAGGAAVMDEATIFNGGQDRFDFRLIGKKEMLIPYNTFRLFDKAACPDSKRYAKGHPASECWRWELHRVWEVEATLKTGARHVYSKRKFYFDEDQPEVGASDNYDAAGKLYRSVFGFYVPFYETSDQGVGDPTITFDFQTGAYFVQADYANGYFRPAEKRQPLRFFTGDALTAEGVR
jgi:hypothetical protein